MQKNAHVSHKTRIFENGLEPFAAAAANGGPVQEALLGRL